MQLYSLCFSKNLNYLIICFIHNLSNCTLVGNYMLYVYFNEHYLTYIKTAYIILFEFKMFIILK